MRRVDRRQRDRLLVARGDQRAPHGVPRDQVARPARQGQRARRQGRRDLAVAPDPRDLLHQVVLDRDVAPERGHHHLEGAVALRRREPEVAQDGRHDLAGRAGAHDPLDAREAKRHRHRSAGRRVRVEHAGGHPAAGQLGDQARGAVQRVPQPLDVRAPLEAVGGLGGQAQGLGRPADGAGREVRALEEHGPRRVTDLGVGAPHHAGHGHGPVGVGDHERRVAERPALPVQRHHRLARPRAADDDVPARQEIAVEGVERVAQLPEHVVRHVDDVVDRAEAGRAQALGEPARRRPHRRRR